MESLKSESDIKSHVDAFINAVNEIVYQKAKEKNITPDLSRSGMSELALKSPSFYSDKINLSPDTFAEARKVYNKLGQFEYNGETDFDRIGEWVGKDSIYIGQFRKGGNIAEGIGIWVYNTGRVYEGYLKSDKAEGLGRFIWPNGNFYIGEWKDDKKNGNGMFKWEDGSMYVGEWKSDKKHGKGTKIEANGSKQSGEWKDGEYIG